MDASIFFCVFFFSEMSSSFISALDLQTVLIGLVVLLLIYILRQRWKNKKYKLPPGPPALPLIGNYEGESSALLVLVVHIQSYSHLALGLLKYTYHYMKLWNKNIDIKFSAWNNLHQERWSDLFFALSSRSEL